MNDNFDYKTEFKNNSKKQSNIEFLRAVRNNNLERVKYLLTSSDIKEKADVHTQNDEALIGACANGDLEIVKYLLTSPELSEHADIHASDDMALICACSGQKLEVVKYLLTSSELKEHANVHANGDSPFFKSWFDDDKKKREVFNYLIFDYQIEKTKEIDSSLTVFKMQEGKILFQKRELKNKLNNNLNNSDKILNVINKVKI